MCWWRRFTRSSIAQIVKIVFFTQSLVATTAYVPKAKWCGQGTVDYEYCSKRKRNRLKADVQRNAFAFNFFTLIASEKWSDQFSQRHRTTWKKIRHNDGDQVLLHWNGRKIKMINRFEHQRFFNALWTCYQQIEKLSSHFVAIHHLMQEVDVLVFT